MMDGLHEANDVVWYEKTCRKDCLFDESVSSSDSLKQNQRSILVYMNQDLLLSRSNASYSTRSLSRLWHNGKIVE